MTFDRSHGFLEAAFAGLVVAALLASGALCGCRRPADEGSPGPAQQGSEEPWTTAQAVQPGDLAREIGAAEPASRPTVVCVGFRPLYRAGHIRGASLHGPASSTEGLDDLKQWAGGLPRSADLVLYCGCCPLVECPNVRPAFVALRDMGFTHLRVLILPHDFGSDWAGKGYPTERESQGG